MRKISFYFLVMVIVMVGCQDDNNDFQLSEKISLQKTGVDSRLHTDNAGVVEKKGIPEMPDDFLGAESSSLKSVMVEDEASDLPLALIAEVDAPVVDGMTLQATHVCFNGNYAYVSYNVSGASYLGAVDVIDITDPSVPQLAMSATFPSMDVSSIAIKDGVLYLVGARDVDEENDVENPAVLVKMTLDGDLLSEDIEFVELSSYVGTDVALGDQYYCTVSGNNGALSVFSLTNNELVSEIELEDLRAVEVDDSKLIVLSGTAGIHVYSLPSISSLVSFPVSDDVQGAKRTIDFYDNYVFVAEGFDGMGVYNVEDGSSKLKIPVATVDNSAIDPNDLVCNAVTTNNSHIFMAEGAAGLVVYSMVNNGLDDLDEIGSLNLEGSANYVENGNDYIFVADGTGGLKILNIVSSDDGENSIQNDYSCSTYPAYRGSSWLNVNSNANQAYRGSASLAGINVGAQLIWCGALAVSQHVNVNSQGEFVVIGSLATGRKVNGNANSGASLNINSKMIVEGALVVYGDLNVNSGGSLEFVGSGSSIAVHGNVRINGSGEIIGDYIDEFGNVE